MDKVNFGLAKFLQFIVIVFFTFVLAFYFGSLLLIPLAILVGTVDILSAIGFNGIFATIVALPFVGWVCYVVYNIPNLFQALLDTGTKMYDVAKTQNKVFEDISSALKPEPKESTPDSNDSNDDNSSTVKPA